MKTQGLICCLFLLISCGPDPKPDVSEKSSTKQLNITILLDLSDRIVKPCLPAGSQQQERDLEAIDFLVQYFKQHMRPDSHGSIQLKFTPEPQNPDITDLAKNLTVNLASLSLTQKKEIYDQLPIRFKEAAQQVYYSAKEEKYWPGADIWRFFRDDVQQCCKDTLSRNILVIITDGYIYHEDSKQQVNNRYAYLLPELLNEHQLRNNPDWKQEMQQQDFGLISTPNDLSNLEVLMLEINPSTGHKNDDDILKTVLKKWLDEMNVKRSEVLFSKLPEYTRQHITDFLDH